MKSYFASTIPLQNIGITKYKYGLMLYEVTKNKNINLLLSLADLFALPYSVYLLDAAGATISINEVGANICGFNSPQQAIGKTIFEVSQDLSAKTLLDNCALILEQETVKMFDEFNTRFDGRALQFLSIKFPCYNTAHRLRGTLGISILLGEHPLAFAITQLTNLGLIPNDIAEIQPLKLNLGNICLTAREKECLEYTIKGFTAKQIAKELFISPRTVEEYINQIKHKLDVHTKREMLQKILSL